MSRPPPSRPPRTPNRTDYDPPSPSTTPTRPLQFNRNPANSNLPNINTAVLGSSPKSDLAMFNTVGPSRPQRSGLRNRQLSEYSEDTASVDSRSTRDSRARDSAEISHLRTYGGTNGGHSQLRDPPFYASPISEKEEPSPETAKAAIAAFQSVLRKKTTTIDEIMDAEYERAREKEMAVQRDRQKRIRDKMPSRKAGKHRPGDIDAVLDEIKDEWGVVTNPDFNPVDLALHLLDGSAEPSFGKGMDSFRHTKKVLSNALKGSVDKNYQAFAAALPHHSSLLNHLGMAQAQISETRNALQEAKDALGSRRADLVQLWSRHHMVEEMLRILDQIEYLRTVPDVLESLISEKRLLQASVLLVGSLKLINKQDMVDIGALTDLRSYLTSQETALREILVDELHSHLYLKSFWCDARWAAYSPNQRDLPIPPYETQGTAESTQLSVPNTPTSPTTRRTRLNRFLDEVQLRPNDSSYNADETSGAPLTHLTSSVGFNSAGNANTNPEADSYAYLETLLESLAILGKLGSALDIVAQKIPQEIYSLVESTLDEVAERAEYGKRGSMVLSLASASLKVDDVYNLLAPGGSTTLGSGVISMGGAGQPRSGLLLAAASLRLAALESSSKRLDQEIMKDLFWTMYSKFDAVVQGLRVVYEVANRIGNRRDFKDSSGAKPGSLFPLAEIWTPVQTEIQTLLNDYITDEEQSAVSGRNPISSINEVLREGKYIRDKQKPVFRFSDTDAKHTSKLLRHHEDELTRALRDTVPGLVQGSLDNSVQAVTLSTTGADDRILGNISGHHHRTLVHPDAFHVTLLLQPTLAFMQRVASILPFGLEDSQNFQLGEFVLRVYLPQLEDKVSLLFHQAVTGPDAFQPDPISHRLSHWPLIKAGIQLLALINSLCVMLATTPFHRENHARLILTVIAQFYQRCSDKFQDLVSLGTLLETETASRVALAAKWAQQAELSPCLTEMLALDRKLESCSLEHLHRQEYHLEANFLGDGGIARDELIATTRDMSTLASLYHSVIWLTSQLNMLKSAPEGSLSPTTPLRLEPISATTPYTPYISSLTAIQPSEQLSLPLSAAMALRFQAILKTYEQLSETMLHTLHVDVRCRIMHHLDLALQTGNYYIEQEAAEPDPHVTDLNVELSKIDEILTRTLPPEERRFVFEGIGHLMENLLVSNARNIRRANIFGIQKMMRNILALQQNVKTFAIGDRPTLFDRAKRFYSLFSVPTADLLDGIREKQEFTFEEYKSLIDLQCGVNPALGENAAAYATDRNYNMYIIELHGLELETSADDSGS